MFKLFRQASIREKLSNIYKKVNLEQKFIKISQIFSQAHLRGMLHIYTNSKEKSCYRTIGRNQKAVAAQNNNYYYHIIIIYN